MQRVRALNKTGRLPFRYSKIGRWWGKNIKNVETEIDIMAIDNISKNYIIGECKFKNKLFDISEFNDLKSKYAPSNVDSKVYSYLFPKSGFTHDLLELQEKDDNIFTIRLSDIVNLKKGQGK